MQGTVYRLSLILEDTRGETTIVDAAINVTRPQTAFLTGPRVIKVAEDAKSGFRIGHFILSNNPEMYRGVSCFIRQVRLKKVKVKPDTQSPGGSTAICIVEF